MGAKCRAAGRLDAGPGAQPKKSDNRPAARRRAKPRGASAFLRKAVAGVRAVIGSLRFEWYLFLVNCSARAANTGSFLGKCISVSRKWVVVPRFRDLSRCGMLHYGKGPGFFTVVCLAFIAFGLTAVVLNSASSAVSISNKNRVAALGALSIGTASDISVVADNTAGQAASIDFVKSASIDTEVSFISTFIADETPVPKAPAPGALVNGLPAASTSIPEAGDSMNEHLLVSNLETAVKEQSRATKTFVDYAPAPVVRQREPRADWNGSFIWPADGPVTSWYGYRVASVGSTNHKGLDITGGRGSAIYAVDDGDVIYAGNDGRFGKVVRILHDSGIVTLYAHCNSLNVSAGDRVRQGQVIAGMGMTGTASGVHLHFEVIIDGVNVNPILYLP